MTERQENGVKKAQVLIEAIPYIRKFRGTTVVIKYGGSAMVDNALKKAVITDIAMLKFIGKYNRESIYFLDCITYPL